MRATCSVSRSSCVGEAPVRVIAAAATLQVARGASAGAEGASQQCEDESSWGYPPARVSGSGKADSQREFIACQRKWVALLQIPLCLHLLQNIHMYVNHVY